MRTRPPCPSDVALLPVLIEKGFGYENINLKYNYSWLLDQVKYLNIIKISYLDIYSRI